jgi:regulator of protease activity HflC (stomatin/prohibitin superfamily)
MASGERPPLNVEALSRIFGGSLIWVALAFLIVVVVLFSSVRIGRVSGEQVGIKLSKISGTVAVVEESGVHFYNGILSDFYTLDRTMQTMEMTGGHRGQSLKVKTIDGSDVYIDLKVQYRIAPGMADTVIRTSGPDDAFKRKWIRDYVRSVARNHLGELTTDEFYDSSKREAQRLSAEQETQTELAPFGIVVDSIVIPSRPVFYQEYEEMIKKKKVADQTVLEEQSKALAATQKQETLRVERDYERRVLLKEYSGTLEKRLIAAKAAADKLVKGSDAYFTTTTIAAEAQLYEMEQRATGILSQKKAEAEGIEELKKALEGEGGRNMVKLEYARRLKDVTITGQPFTVDGRTERFQHMNAPAVAPKNR